MKTMTRWMVLATMLLLALPALAVDPPGLMNYQGVLRDDNDVPLDGSYDMVFRFYDDANPAGPENEIFVDEHLASGTGAVTVSGGLFDVVLGSGNFYDGSGPGDHPHIYYVFGLHETVYLEVQIGAEILQPRMQVVSAPYAIHAAVLGGYTPSDFINTSSEEQEKIGLLRALGGVDFGGGANDDLTAGDVTGLTSGPGNYADFLHSHSYVDNADTVDGKHASEFINTSSSAQVKSGPLALDASTTPSSYGVQGLGQNGGGLFVDSNESGVAVVGAGHYGVQASGNVGGAYFSITGLSAEAKIASSDSGGLGLDAYGDAKGGYFHSSGTGEAHLAAGDQGVSGIGNESGGHFQNGEQPSTEARLGYRDPLDPAHQYGVWARGSHSGGYFQNGSNSAVETHLAYYDDLGHLFGVHATGLIGGRFETTTTSAVATLAQGGTGVFGIGDSAGGEFRQSDQHEYAFLGYHNDTKGDLGVMGGGRTAGGYFEDTYDSGYARVGSGHNGILAYGDSCGGYFSNTDGTGDAWLGRTGLGIMAYGNEAGGHFNLNSGLSEAYVAYSDASGDEYGVWATGSKSGGHFLTPGETAIADLGYTHTDGKVYGVRAKGGDGGGFFGVQDDSGYAYVGSANHGLMAYGELAGGYFRATNGGSGLAYVGFLDEGISASGNTRGGHFNDFNESGEAYIAWGHRGIWAMGSLSGGTFSDTIPATNVWADVAFTTGTPPNQTFHKVTGNGQVGFVQNHPEDPNQVIIYAAPEGDETAVYTRGTARLVDGEARVALGETFQWVTNPDLGLTAYVTPRDEAVPLAVVEVTPRELVVRGPVDVPADLVFDYIVYGLRIGFERAGPLQAKWREAPLPSPQIGEEFYALEGPAPLSALERFTRMTVDVRGVAPEELDLSGATALREAIRASNWQQIGMDPVGDGTASAPPPGAAPVGPMTDDGVDGTTRAAVDPTAHQELERESTEPTSPFTMFPISENVEVGDVLVLDDEQPGQLRRADRVGDPNVVGIVAEEPRTVDGQLRAPVALYGLASVKVDASHGVILAGDLLTTSPTPGHAGLAVVPTPGTVIGKALEPLESGTGSIQVLVMPR